MLARAEFRFERRRRIILVAPTTLAAFTSLYGIVTAHHPNGFPATMMEVVPALAWIVALVVFPLAAALKPRPVRAGAMMSLVFGPLLMPLVFGPGGWRVPEILLILASTAGALAPRRRLVAQT